MNSSLQSRGTSVSGMTRTELLVVIGVIAILVLYLRSAGSSVRVFEQARKAQAKADVVAIYTAIKAYHEVYGYYPLGAQADADHSRDVLYGESGVDNYQLFDILRNVDSTGATPPSQPNRYNPKGIVFFDGKIVTDPTNPRAGFVPPDVTSPYHAGCYIDPWGSQYRIAIDGDADGQITILPYKDFGGKTNGPRAGSVAYSLGKDQKLGTNGDMTYKAPGASKASDDIISWQ